MVFCSGELDTISVPKLAFIIWLNLFLIAQKLSGSLPTDHTNALASHIEVK